MSKEKHSSEKITESTLHELLSSINARLGHLEDIEADNRAIIIKLVKQNNSIVEFLRGLEIEELDMYEDSVSAQLPDLPNSNYSKNKLTKQNMKDMVNLVEDLLARTKELKEFEKELQKHKDKLTPGQIGES